MVLGEKVRRLRESKGKLLRQVASAIDADTAFISKLERGERNATKEQVRKLSRYFNVSEEDLMILWLSDKLLSLIEGEPSAVRALKLTAKRLKQSN